MPSTLDQVLKTSATRLGENIDRHRATKHVSLDDHVQQTRSRRAARIVTKRIVYLDTNAWKCLADFHQARPTLTSAMSEFAIAIHKTMQRDDTIFPIELATFFELDSMTYPNTRDALAGLVDELSKGYCIAPFPERIGQELQQLRMGNFNPQEDVAKFLRSPVEILGTPPESFEPRFEALVDENTFNKAMFDTLSELPFSSQLAAYSSQVPKWNHSGLTDGLNQGKKDHQDQVTNLNTWIFRELKGCIEAHCIGTKADLNPKQVVMLTLQAQHHWQQVPSSKAFPTMRILSSLHGLMMFDPQRRFQDCDSNDFLVAAAALPVAHAFLTDRRLANLLADPRIGLKKFNGCKIVSSFEEMAHYVSQNT
jgi:hypothetical protein